MSDTCVTLRQIQCAHDAQVAPAATQLHHTAWVQCHPCQVMPGHRRPLCSQAADLHITTQQRTPTAKTARQAYGKEACFLTYQFDARPPADADHSWCTAGHYSQSLLSQSCCAGCACSHALCRAGQAQTGCQSTNGVVLQAPVCHSRHLTLVTSACPTMSITSDQI